MVPYTAADVIRVMNTDLAGMMERDRWHRARPEIYSPGSRRFAGLLRWRRPALFAAPKYERRMRAFRAVARCSAPNQAPGQPPGRGRARPHRPTFGKALLWRTTVGRAHRSDDAQIGMQFPK